jgi:hypothetical protein
MAAGLRPIDAELLDAEDRLEPLGYLKYLLDLSLERLLIRFYISH